MLFSFSRSSLTHSHSLTHSRSLTLALSTNQPTFFSIGVVAGAALGCVHQNGNRKLAAPLASLAASAGSGVGTISGGRAGGRYVARYNIYYFHTPLIHSFPEPTPSVLADSHATTMDPWQPAGAQAPPILPMMLPSAWPWRG